MKLKDTTSAACHPEMSTIIGAAAHQKLELAARLRFHLVGLYHCEVGPAWDSQGRQESDYLHHIDIVLSGRRQVVFQDRVLDLQPGCAYWLPGNTPLVRRYVEPGRVMFLKLRSEWLPGIDPFLDWPGRQPVLIGRCEPAGWRAMLRPQWQATTNRLLQLQAWVLESVAKAVPDLDKLIASHLKTHAVYDAVFTLVEEKLGANLKIEALAAAHGTSPHAFSTTFTRNTGMTPKAYLKRRLNQEAISLFTGTDVKIKEIAGRLKFYDEYHFIRFFSKLNGAPPFQYRQSLRKAHR